MAEASVPVDQSASEVEEPIVHTIIVHGGGYFSRAECTGCDWAYKGSAEDCRRIWGRYHDDNGVQSAPLPRREPVPDVPEDWRLQRIEARIIQLLCHFVDFQKAEALFAANGHAEARAILMADAPTAPQQIMQNAQEYVSLIAAKIAHLSKRQREKIRHPSRNREEMQRILNGETL